MSEAFSLLGHDDAMQEVRDAFVSGRMHHAWLIAGIEGIGKATLAKHIAQIALSGSDLKAAKLVEMETHPDLLIIRRPVDEKTGEQKNVIPVDDALKVASFLHKTATHGGWRVVIIDEAHTLNRHGQNAILKIVEEPPPRTLILLTLTTPGAMLATIRSRARLLRLSPLDEAHMRAILMREGHADAVDMNTLIALSGGSVGFALKILRAEALPLYREMLGLLEAMPQLDVARLHKLADQVAKKADAESFEVLTTLLIDRLREIAQIAAKKQGRVDTALQIWDETQATFDGADHANLDRKLAFINALTDIRAAV